MKDDFLKKEWLDTHLKQVKNKAGQRYTPKLNVDLPISEIFDGLCRTKSFYTSIRTHFGKIEREFSGISTQYNEPETKKSYDLFSKKIISLLEILRGVKEYDIKTLEWKKISAITNEANELSWKLADKLRDEKEKKEKEPDQNRSTNGPSLSDRISFDIHNIYEIQKELRYFENFSTSTVAQLSNFPFLLLKGLAGSGKTHLLCDVVERRTDDAVPSVLVFGEFFSSGDVYQQISTQLCLGTKYNKDKIFKKMNEAGKKTGTRSLLIIDALNESNPSTYWKNKLHSLVKEIKKYPNIALAISIRSCFEKDILTNTSEKLFISEEHRGFQFREWEAVNKFFKEFSLPLPEIPLLMPEFQNPLFLLLFCKAFQSRAKKNNGKKQKQVFRGHEGATYIFETYVDTISKKIEDDFGIDHGPNKNIWDTVIEKVAAEMVEKNADRIPESILADIVRTAHPRIYCTKLIGAIEKNFLLIKVPHYSPKEEKSDGFDYRFPFQKFSDHLIGRFIFKKLKSSKKTPRQYFSKNTKIGKFIKAGWNRGIVEALSIQSPEWLNGIEFFEVAPYVDDWIAVEAFIESLVWRRPDAFPKGLKSTLNFINKKVVVRKEWHDSLLNAFLSIAAIPDHPFNSLFLHKHLSKFPMPKRDSWWSTFLHYQYGERGTVDRLIEWGWSNQDKKHISDEAIKLSSIALIWFLTTSNRFLRDKATKALVSILTERLNVLVDLLELFKGTDDPYLIERLYAVAYGCVMRNNSDKKGIKKIADWFLINFFKKNDVVAHILMRDYARGTVEVAIRYGVVNKAEYQIVIPSYGSKWPKKIPTEKALRKKYYPEEFFSHKTEERGFLDIWSSVMHDFGSLADFGNYEVNPELGRYSGRRLGGKEIKRKQFYDEFKKGLTEEQLKLLNKTNPFYGIDFKSIRIILERTDEIKEKPNEADLEKMEKDEKKVRKEALKQFKETLSEEKRGLFKKEIEPYLDDRGNINDPLERFNTGLGQRWIFNRVVELGWDPKLHGKFDSDVNRNIPDRREHKSERIGKKYQWIALHELLALVSDNFEFTSERWNDETFIYEGAWQNGIRDIDPTCTLKEPSDDKKIGGLPFFNDHKPKYKAWKKNKSLKSWLSDKKNLPDPISVIKYTDDTGYDWVALQGFCEWQEKLPPEFEKYKLPTRTLYYMMKSYLIKNKDDDRILNWAKKQKFYGRWMPESHDFYGVFLGEYPSYPAFLYHYIPFFNHDGWTNGGGRNKIPAKILVTDDEYLSSGSSIDCSCEQAIRIKLPAKWLIDKMKLKQKYTDGRFYDKAGELTAFDPAVFTNNAPPFVLIRKDKLCSFLRREKLDIFWTLLGEKQTIGGGGIGQPEGWQEISGVYTLNANCDIVGSMTSEFKKPTPQTKQKKSKRK